MIKLSTEERDELDALCRMNDALDGPSHIMRSHWHQSGYRRLVRVGLVMWGDPPRGFTKRLFAGTEITDAGRAALAYKEG